MPYGLTQREAEVLQLIAEARTNKEIAAALGISKPTAQRHVSNIRIKMGATTRVEVAVRAVREGLVD